MPARTAMEKSGIRHCRNTEGSTQADTGFLTKGFTAPFSPRVRGDVLDVEKWQCSQSLVSPARDESQAFHKASE